MSELENSPSPKLSSKDNFTLSILRFFSRLSLPTLQWLGLLIGSMAAWFPHGPAWVIRRNLKLCFPEQNQRWINDTTKQNLIYTAQTAFSASSRQLGVYECVGESTRTSCDYVQTQ